MSIDNTLWMGEIEPWMTREIIMDFFIKNNIYPSSIKLLKDHKYNINRNYCFINFDSKKEANKALINLNGKIIPNTNINFKLNWANLHCELNMNLYVGNLSRDIDDIQLFNILQKKYKGVHHVSIITDKGKSKGYGFIQFNDKESYYKCLQEMDGYIINGKAINVKERTYKNKTEKNCRNIKDCNINNNLNKYNKLNININNNNIRNKFKPYNNNNQSNINNKYIFNNYYNYNNFKESFNNESDEDYQELSSSNSSSTNTDDERRKFSDNLDLILNDDRKILNQKIKESVDKMYEHYKYFSKNNEVSNMIVYYSSSI